MCYLKYIIQCTLLLLLKYYNVDANLSASGDVISGNEPSSEMFTSQSQNIQFKNIETAMEFIL